MRLPYGVERRFAGGESQRLQGEFELFGLRIALLRGADLSDLDHGPLGQQGRGEPQLRREVGRHQDLAEGERVSAQASGVAAWGRASSWAASSECIVNSRSESL